MLAKIRIAKLLLNEFTGPEFRISEFQTWALTGWQLVSNRDSRCWFRLRCSIRNSISEIVLSDKLKAIPQLLWCSVLLRTSACIRRSESQVYAFCAISESETESDTESETPIAKTLLTNCGSWATLVSIGSYSPSYSASYSANVLAGWSSDSLLTEALTESLLNL